MSIADFLKKGIIYWPNWLNLLLLRLNVLRKLVYGFSYFKARRTIYKKLPEILLLENVNHAIRNVKYYRDRYKDVRIDSIEDFKSKIGFIDKEEVMRYWDDFLIDNIDLKRCVISTTGGTSGKPLKIITPKNRYIRESVFIHKVRERTNWKVGDRRAMLRNHRLPPNRKYLINPVTKDFIFDAFRIDEAYAREIYDILKKYKIEAIHAYPSALFQFFKLCEKQDLNLSIIKSCLLSSEPLTEEQHFFFSKLLSMKISFTYGHSEKLILASNEPDSNSTDLIVEPHYGYLELIDDTGIQIESVGGIGEMIGSTFSNKYMPLIRYRTGDYAEYGGRIKTDGGIEKLILKKIYGRWNKSTIYKANGTRTSLTALNLHGDFYNHIDGMQYIQEKKGYLTILLIKNERYTSRDEEFILDHIGNAMGGNKYVKIRYVDKLFFQSNGKFLPIISKVDP